MLKAEWFNLRRLDHLEKYYPIVKAWWEGKGDKWKTVFNPGTLSSNGIIVKSDEEYICAGWLYSTDSCQGIIGAIITNNNQKIGKLKKEALKYLLIKLEELSKKIGVELLYIPMETRSVSNLIENNGFTRTSENISEFYKTI